MHEPDPTPRPLDHLALTGRRDAPALSDKSGMLDHAGLDRAVGALGAGLLARGLAPGDRVASWLPKNRIACLMPLAAARAGLVHVPVNPLLKHGQVAHILADSGARLLITGRGRAGSIEPSDWPHSCSLLVEEEEGATLFEASPLPPSSADPQDLVAILYTSGSTGRPKGVMLSHANLWLGAVSVSHYLGLAPDDRTLALLPLSFDYGQNQLLSTWAAGGCVHPLDYLTPRDVVRAVGKHGITTLAGVPPLWIQLAEIDWPAECVAPLRRLTNTGGRMSVALVRRLRGLCPQARLFSMYGLTEAFRSTWLDPDLVDLHPESIGTAIPFAEVMVVRPDGSLAADNEPGELVHAGPLVGQGYWQDAERTAQRFRPAPAASTYGGTAVWSGDTVVRDAGGLLRFVGRDDEMIKSSGNRISPTEIEEAAVASGAAAEAVALGIADERLGQAILVYARPVGEGADARLADWFKRNLPGFMQPARVIWRDELPRNANGKLDRAALKAEAGGMKPTGPIPPDFVRRAGELMIGGRTAGEWIEQAGDTPLFVYDMGIVRNRIARFRAAFPGVSLHYAVKANPHASLVRAIADHVDGLDVASAGEARLAIDAGMDARRISFAGPGKRDRELEMAIDAGITLNLESEGEAERALAIGRGLGRTPRLAVRVNPDFELKGSGMKMGGGAKPFGIDADRAAAVVRRIVDAGADYRGLHIFAGSQALDASAIIDAQRSTLALAARISGEAGVMPPHVNLGGGLGVRYFAPDGELDEISVGKALVAALAHRPAILADTEFTIELGRWLVGEAGVYLTRIVDRKTSHGETFLVVDGGLHHQLAASGNFGTVVRRNYPISLTKSSPDLRPTLVSVVGCLCTPLDRLGDQVELPQAEVGEVVALFLAGAYGASASPQGFLGHPPLWN